MHGLNENYITITEYETNGETFSENLHFVFADTFGLDELDVEEKKQIIGPIAFRYGMNEV